MSSSPLFQPLPLEFYRNPDVCAVARSLLGTLLISQIGGVLTGGKIIETEAYAGVHDRACHSYNYRRTPRTEVMYSAGGVTYVYLCYGIHYLLNVITGEAEDPQGVLIRALDPLYGLETMRIRRNKKKIDKTLTQGPGAVTQALGITQAHNGLLLNGSLLFIAENPLPLTQSIVTSPRIGIDYAGEDAFLPYRFTLE